MAYDLELAERVRALLTDHDGVAERAMFGGLAFLLDGHMVVVVSGRGGLMIRTNPHRAMELAQSTPAVFAEMRGRVMKAWLRIHPSDLETSAQLQNWVDLALLDSRTSRSST